MTRKTTRPIVIGALLTAAIFLSYQQGLLQTAELKSLDLRFQLRGAIAPTLPIVLVSIDEDSFDELNQRWPWPRTLHANLIDRLAEGGARLIAIDVLFPEPAEDPESDKTLARALKNARNVVLAAEFTEVPGPFGKKQSMKLPIPELRDSALAYGPVNLVTDDDGVVRRARTALEMHNRTFPSFAYQIASALKGERSPEKARSAGALIGINFRGPARSYPIIPYYRIVTGEIPPESFRDKIVLVGAFAPSLKDNFMSPFSASRLTAGVEVQANLLETIVSDTPIVSTPLWLDLLTLVFLAAVTIFISIRMRPLAALGVVVVLVLTYTVTDFYLFLQNRLAAPLVMPLLGMTLVYGGITVENYLREYKERVLLRTTFSRYVSPDVVDEILENPAGLGLSGQRRHITILFSDIRGFTSISENIEPEQVVELLDDYLGEVTRIVFKNGGTVDKFIGDAVMALFGAPKSYEDNARRAVQTGLDMIGLVNSLGPKWEQAIGRPFRVGVGINSGEAVVGRIGSEIRSDFTAIGDSVNLASRLEALTKDLGVSMLVSEFTVAEMADPGELKPLRRVSVVGRETPLLVYTPESLMSEEAKAEWEGGEVYVQQKK